MKAIYYRDFEDILELNRWVNQRVRTIEIISIETLPNELKRLWVREEALV